MSFIDDCTRVTWVFLMKHKSNVSTMLPIFHKMAKTSIEPNHKLDGDKEDVSID